MPTIHHPSLLVVGIMVLAIGILLFRWSGRHDMKGLAMAAAWKAATSRGRSAITPEIQAKIDAFNADPSTVGRGKQVAGMTIRHVVAQVVGLASYVAILGGFGLAAAGIWWK
jgi:hypothetical protein